MQRAGEGHTTVSICVVYLTASDGQPIASPPFNRILVDSGHAEVKDFDTNEFDPVAWWEPSYMFEKATVKGVGYKNVEALIDALKDEDWCRHLQAAAIALGDIGDPRAVEPLTYLASNDDDERVREAATAKAWKLKAEAQGYR